MKIYVDGAAFPNDGTGKKFISVCLVNDGEIEKVEDSFVKEMGIGTNNEAEYEAVVEGLKYALSRGADSVEIFTDSLLVIKQLQGKWNFNGKFKKYIEEFNALKSENFLTDNWLELVFVRSVNNIAHNVMEKHLRIMHGENFIDFSEAF